MLNDIPRYIPSVCDVVFATSDGHSVMSDSDMDIHKLARLDAEKSSMYAQGCRSNGITALCFAEDLQVYGNRYGGFGLDWRKISPLSEPFTGGLAAARKNAEWQNQVWCEKVVPHRYMEHVVLGNAIFGLWMR